jgi:hypothetical protein
VIDVHACAFRAHRPSARVRSQQGPPYQTGEWRRHHSPGSHHRHHLVEIRLELVLKLSPRDSIPIKLGWVLELHANRSAVHSEPIVVRETFKARGALEMNGSRHGKFSMRVGLTPEHRLANWYSGNEDTHAQVRGCCKGPAPE